MAGSQQFQHLQIRQLRDALSHLYVPPGPQVVTQFCTHPSMPAVTGVPAGECHASDSRGKALLEVPPRPAASKPSSPICSTLILRVTLGSHKPLDQHNPLLSLPSSCLSPFCSDLFFSFLNGILIAMSWLHPLKLDLPDFQGWSCTGK